jgi:hypothetical protein
VVFVQFNPFQSGEWIISAFVGGPAPGAKSDRSKSALERFTSTPYQTANACLALGFLPTVGACRPLHTSKLLKIKGLSYKTLKWIVY